LLYYYNYNSIEDIDGNIYPTVMINGKEWMAENLRVKRFNNGENIASADAWYEWSVTNSPSTNLSDSLSFFPYGKLYNFYAVSDNRNICPAGWHVPTDQEYTEMITSIDPEAITNSSTITQSYKAAKTLKSRGVTYWSSKFNSGTPYSDATNESGFSALPAAGIQNGVVYGFGIHASFWTASSANDSSAYIRGLSYVNSSVGRLACDKRSFLSVRCIKD
jgi:uncharacterized protein (TIGR02145 family)